MHATNESESLLRKRNVLPAKTCNIIEKETQTTQFPWKENEKVGLGFLLKFLASFFSLLFLLISPPAKRDKYDVRKLAVVLENNYHISRRRNHFMKLLRGRQINSNFDPEHNLVPFFLFSHF